MARKDKDKKKKEKIVGWGKEEAKEELVADALKRTDLDEGRVKLIDRDLSTPVIETYDKDTGDIEGSIILKNKNREGLLAQVKIIEDVEVSQDHDGNIGSMSFAGKLNIENPSSVDRLWDIDIELKNIGSTNLKSKDISIRELSTEEPDNIESHEFQLKGEATNLLLVKEFISTLPHADDMLNVHDIETEMLKLKDKTTKATKLQNKPKVEPTPKHEEEEEEEEEEDEGETWQDGGSSTESGLETFGISIDKENVVTFAIALRSEFDKPVSNIKVVKNIPDDFTNPRVKSKTIGRTEIEGNKVIWTVDKLPPEQTVVLKFTCDIYVTDITKRKTGTVNVTYQAASSFAEGMDIDKFDAYTRNKFYVDTVERDEEPGVWDCKLVFDNSSEFIIQLFNADVYSAEDDSIKFIDIDPDEVPLLPSGAQWHSKKWRYESSDYPSFRKKLEFRVMPDFRTIVNGSISISDVILEIASITGEMKYDKTETPTYKDQDIIATLKMANNGSAPLNEVIVIQQYFTNEYNPPNANEIKMIWDGDEVELDSSAVSVDAHVFKISLSALKDSSTGMFEPDSTIEFEYPIHCVSPAKESTFESEIIYHANTFPASQELEFKPAVPAIEALHIRRKFRIGKEVIPIGALGNYRIILTLENIGESKLYDLVLMDKVPDSFEYGSYSMQPEITDEVGEDTLKWTIETLEEGDRLEITYEISGTGDYSPSEAQLAL